MGRAKRTFRRKLHLLGRLDRTVSGITLLAFDAETAEVGTIGMREWSVIPEDARLGHGP